MNVNTAHQRQATSRGHGCVRRHKHQSALAGRTHLELQPVQPQTWPNNISSDWPNHNRCCIAINHSSDGEETKVPDGKVPSRYARILFLWAGLKQWPMDCFVSRIRRWKRSRSRPTSSQCPLRDACRANGHVRMTCTWTRGEKLTWKHRRKERLGDEPENSQKVSTPHQPVNCRKQRPHPPHSQAQFLDSDTFDFERKVNLLSSLSSEARDNSMESTRRLVTSAETVCRHPL